MTTFFRMAEKTKKLFSRDLKVGMSSHFFNFVFKSSQCPQMKVLNERISE